MRRIKKSVGIFHLALTVAGGAEAKPLFIAEALKNDYDVTLITSHASSLEELNKYYGTHLSYEDVRIIIHPLSFILKRLKGLVALRGALFSRFGRKLSDSFDLVISTSNMMNFEKPGIQFMKGLGFSDAVWRELGRSSESIIHKDNVFRRTYLSVVKRISLHSEKGFKRNLTIANSKWLAKLLEMRMGIKCRVVYPPVMDGFIEFPWEKRCDDFVYIGRLAQEKRIEDIIEIASRLREKGSPLKLHLVGPHASRNYSSFLKDIAKKRGDWIIFEGLKYKDQKQAFLVKYKYGITAHPNEPFGISIAEMVKAGMIVWVPDGGGQVEIVDHPLLIYRDSNDAVEKIREIIGDRKKQEELRAHLGKMKNKFSIDIFKSEVKAIVQDYFE